ncbi:MAG: permease [Pseudomonadota bacterium]
MQRVLSLEQSPPLQAVLRFFLSTPLFVLLAGALLAWQGPDALVSRWSPCTLALTHLLTLGALGMSMTGALIQILPVVAGVNLARIRAPLMHALLGVGTLALAAGFLSGAPWLFRAALATLIPVLLWLCGCVTVALWQPQAAGAAPMLGTVRLAVGSLVITLALAAMLGAAFAWPGMPSPLPLLRATDLHAMWGVFGWGGLLVAGVAFQVVPMFQVTPLYPDAVHQRLGVAVFLLLVASSAEALFARTGVIAAYACFAGVTLWLLARRKRPQPDAMTLFWRLSMASLGACFLLWLMPDHIAGPGRPLALGILAIVGFLYSAINGMLYKIVPFLIWHHLQDNAAPGVRAPGVKHILPDAKARAQFWVQAGALLLLLAACWHPASLARPAGLALAVSAMWLGWNLTRAISRPWPAMPVASR